MVEWADDMKNIFGDYSIQISDPVIIASDNANTSKNEQLYAINYAKSCPDDKCVLGSIVKFADTMTASYAADSTNSNGTSIYESLMFLTHLLGDLHEPIHAGRLSDQNGLELNVAIMDFYNEGNRWAPFSVLFATVPVAFNGMRLESACCLGLEHSHQDYAR